MKIEKITENKIRIIMYSSELESKNLDVSFFETPSIENQTFFVELLEKAEIEVGFTTTGCKLLIEFSSSAEDYFIFTVTRYFDKNKAKTTVNMLTKRTSKSIVYNFNNFDEFCEFCICISKLNSFNIQKLSKNVSLYYYKNTYYLLLKNINISYLYKKIFYSIALEFSKPLSNSNTLENKLMEYGNIIIKNNAIEKGIKYFS